jgi:SDR family mycofactocin-dependent oxidoreductase
MSPHERTSVTRRGILVKGGAIAAGAALAPTATGRMGTVTAAQEAEGESGAFAGQAVIVTGAARGIGRAIAVELATRGADVMAYDILEPIETYRAPGATEADMAETVRLIEAVGRKAIPVKGDVRSLQQLRAAVEQAIAEFGKLDILVANAGIGGEALVGEMEEQVWQDVIDINLTGVFKSYNAVLPHMLERQQGRLIAISSVAGRFGGAGGANYSAAKWGIIGLTKAVAREYGKQGIRANAVAPTFVETLQVTNERYLREILFPDNPNPSVADVDALAETFHTLPVGMLAPEDVARAVAFLLSDDARYLSGVVLDVAAGWNATWAA